MSGDLQDAFLERGFGIGATYAPFPFIRIDYQLFDKDKFEIVDFKRIKEGSSDHYGCVTEFTINPSNNPLSAPAPSHKNYPTTSSFYFYALTLPHGTKCYFIRIPYTFIIQQVAKRSGLSLYMRHL
jgi:hypothetical protein